MKALAPRSELLHAGLDRHAGWILLAIVALALGVRVWSLDAGLPYIYHPDEPHYVQISQNILKYGDLNPHFFNYPSLFFYLNAAAYLPFFLVGKLFNFTPTLDSIPTPVVEVLGVGHTDMPASLLVGRYLTVALAIGAIILVYWIARKLLKSKVAGLIAALFMAVSTTNVTHSRLITPDTQVTFFILLSFLGCVFVYERGKTHHYVLAGVAAGLAISSKYNGTIVLVALLVAHLLGEGWPRALSDKRIYMALGLALLTFIATSPYALLDFARFFSDLRAEFVHYSSGHHGWEGNSLTWYVDYLWANEGVVALLALVEAIRALWARRAREVLLIAFPLCYFVFINLFTVRNDRTLLPLTPFLFLLAAAFLARLLEMRPALQPMLLPNGRLLMQHSSPAGSSPSSAGFALVAVSALFLFVQMVSNTGTAVAGIQQKNAVRAWIEKHIPAGSNVALESYAVFIDPERYTVEGFSRLINNGPQWYKDQGFEYLVFSSGMFGRYYGERVRYAKEVAQYDSFFRAFTMVQIFPDERNEIRIYTVDGEMQAGTP